MYLYIRIITRRRKLFHSLPFALVEGGCMTIPVGDRLVCPTVVEAMAKLRVLKLEDFINGSPIYILLKCKNNFLI